MDASVLAVAAGGILAAVALVLQLLREGTARTIGLLLALAVLLIAAGLLGGLPAEPLG